MPLTELAIKALKPTDKLYRVADSGGLCLEVTPTGSKLWRWRYNFNGKAQMLALGKYPAVSLAQARKARDTAREELKGGKHPTREKKARKLRQMVAGENTFETVCRKWLAHKSKSLNEKYATQSLARMEQHVFPLIGELPITEIAISDIVKVLEKLAASVICHLPRQSAQGSCGPAAWCLRTNPKPSYFIPKTLNKTAPKNGGTSMLPTSPPYFGKGYLPCACLSSYPKQRKKFRPKIQAATLSF